MKSKFLFLLMLPLFLLAGCSKEDDNPADDYGDKTVDDAYYVRYEVSMPLENIPSYPHPKEVTYIDEEGEQSFKTMESSWSATYGPFRKHTKLYLNVIAGDGVIKVNDWYARLYVSRNNHPFIIKAEDRAEDSASSLSLSYTIDF